MALAQSASGPTLTGDTAFSAMAGSVRACVLPTNLPTADAVCAEALLAPSALRSKAAEQIRVFFRSKCRER
ncbi:hypothetical protein MGN01_38860 [Methylobacterium gnaphalii]|uniref:Uncharacterized protein n=1 Tax=Methylobacterium gnaphalii TaxID=1010610 RepID=A0A512JQ28_9HYPH|nr:hypothetical protein MGN01_38860 [Methylobacterium gnaphalii]GLS48632.1 hypothetical protein GCM10007885_14760 [Methylobacterium gnaphalii]